MQAIKVRSKREENKQRGTGYPEPPGAPPWWQNLDLQGYARFAPRTPVGCALHSEPIDARRQSGVVHKPLSAADFVPVRIQPVQLVTIVIPRGIRVTEGGKLKREHALPGREGQGICRSDGLLERRTASNLNRTAPQPKSRENHWGCVRVFHNSVRVEDSSSAKTPKEHLSASILEARALAGQVRARQSVSSRITLYLRALRIESRDPIIGTHPKVAVVIFEDAAHCIAKDAIPPCVVGERTRLRVKLVQPVLGYLPT